MQTIFFDIPAGVLQRTPRLQNWLELGMAQSGIPRQYGYDRILLKAETQTEILDLLEEVAFDECGHWILLEEKGTYRYLLEPEVYQEFQLRTRQRILKMEPQLRSVIRQDLEQIAFCAECFNLYGYFRFSAKKLKRLLQRLLQEEYHRVESELEQEEFIELLRFFISVQPPVLEYASLTLYENKFTLTDEWGNDLRQIYLDSLLEEEIVDVSENDLIMSILITLLPREIHLEIKEPPASAEFLVMLQRVFGEQLVWKKAEGK